MNYIIGLGHMGLAVTDLDRRERFDVDALGMQLAEKDPGVRLRFRMG